MMQNSVRSMLTLHPSLVLLHILLYSCVDRDSFVNKTYLYYDLFITTIGREGDWHLAGISPHQSGRAIFGQPAAKNEKKPVRLEAQFFGC